MAERNFNPSRKEKMTVEEFVQVAIKALRMGDFKGIHSVYSGFNEAFKNISGRIRCRLPTAWLKKKD